MNNVIPEAAVEAAAELLAMASPEDWSGDQWANEKIDDSYREPWRKQARLILEAAAPHMLAEAWDQGEEFGEDRDAYEPITNPYRTTK